MRALARVIPILIVALAVAVMVRRTRQGGSPRGAGGRGGPTRGGLGLGGTLLGSFGGETGIIVAREVGTRIRGRLFRFGTLLILAVLALAIWLPTLQHGRSHPERVAVVGTLSSEQRTLVLAAGTGVGATVHLADIPDVSTARGEVGSGRADLAIVDARDLIVKTAVESGDTSTTAELTRAVARDLGISEAYRAAGLSTAQVSRIADAKPLPVTSLVGSGASGTGRTTAVFGLVLVFMMLTQYNTWTLTGVMEEKSSRVAEVLLAAVRPAQLLTGKVLGIALVAFAQVAIVVAVAGGLARVVGSNFVQGISPLVLAGTVAWLVLGYAFYCWIYAAAGSLAERQDQVQSLSLPLALPLIFGYIMGVTTLSSGNPSTFFEVLAYLPPTAPFAMPVLVALGRASWWQFTVSALISVACTVAVARLATVIYRRAILRTGRRVRLREVLSAR